MKGLNLIIWRSNKAPEVQNVQKDLLHKRRLHLQFEIKRIRSLVKYINNNWEKLFESSPENGTNWHSMTGRNMSTEQYIYTGLVNARDWRPSGQIPVSERQCRRFASKLGLGRSASSFTKHRVGAYIRSTVYAGGCTADLIDW